MICALKDLSFAQMDVGTMAAETTDRLWLGTVQLGLPYGLAGRQLDEAEAFAVLDAAWQAGIRHFDCARAYGEAEDRLGRWTRARKHAPVTATKIPSLKDASEDHRVSTMQRALDASRRALGVEQIAILMLHRAEDFFAPGVEETLTGFLETGAVGRIGLSGYDIPCLSDALAKTPCYPWCNAPETRWIGARLRRACRRSCGGDRAP